MDVNYGPFTLVASDTYWAIWLRSNNSYFAAAWNGNQTATNTGGIGALEALKTWCIANAMSVQQSQIALSSNPSGAYIRLDGSALGLYTPATFNVTPGYHEIRVSKDGYQDAIWTGNVPQQVSYQITLTLQVLPPPPPPPPPGESYITSVDYPTEAEIGKAFTIKINNHIESAGIYWNSIYDDGNRVSISVPWVVTIAPGEFQSTHTLIMPSINPGNNWNLTCQLVIQ